MKKSRVTKLFLRITAQRHALFLTLAKHLKSFRKIQLKLLRELRLQNWAQFVKDRQVDARGNNMSPNPEGNILLAKREEAKEVSPTSNLQKLKVK